MSYNLTVGPTGPQGEQGPQGDPGPPGPGGTGSPGSWDWAALDPENLDVPSVDQLQGNVDLTKWTPAENGSHPFGSDPRLVAMTSLTEATSMGGKAIVAYYDDAVQSATGGIYMPTVAGDFVYAFRMGFQHRDNLSASSINSQVAAVYIHSTTTIPNQNWYGAGLQRGNVTINNAKFGSTQKSVSNWWTVGSDITYLSAGLWPGSFDVWLRKSGTSLEAWGAVCGSTPMFLTSWALGVTGADAGMVGMRVNKAGSDVDQVAGILYAFARVSSIPGL